MPELTIPPPTELKYHKRSRELEVRFADGMNARLTAEYLRVHSPSAEVKGHAAGEGMLVTDKETVGAAKIEPVGRYAVRLVFDDVPQHGPLTWQILYELRRTRAQMEALSRAARASRPDARGASKGRLGRRYTIGNCLRVYIRATR
ncbi:MAG TPA: gamma-butyrobetaine hydroxylase-like domain-containing protein [Vicinamibacterales bacterium]|jgi:DUF971 family protein|nr:gamma-butyrobetaine hydroxylase-like domain-containing protein [Vicinamibacterales bacterium]